MFDAVLDLISDLDGMRLSQERKEAVLDALLLVMHADGKLDLEEKCWLEKILDRCHWSGKEQLGSYLLKKRMEVIGVLQQPAQRLEPFVEDVIGRINSRTVMRQLYLLCDRMANADHRVTTEEVSVLDTMVELFHC